MKIFAKMPDIALFFRVFLLNGFLSLFGSTFNYLLRIAKLIRNAEERP
jgi:hypothetical protein